MHARVRPRSVAASKVPVHPPPPVSLRIQRKCVDVRWNNQRSQPETQGRHVDETVLGGQNVSRPITGGFALGSKECASAGWWLFNGQRTRSTSQHLIAKTAFDGLGAAQICLGTVVHSMYVYIQDDE